MHRSVFPEVFAYATGGYKLIAKSSVLLIATTMGAPLHALKAVNFQMHLAGWTLTILIYFAVSRQFHHNMSHLFYLYFVCMCVFYRALFCELFFAVGSLYSLLDGQQRGHKYL